MARTRLFGNLRRIAAPAMAHVDAEKRLLTRRQLTLADAHPPEGSTLAACANDDAVERRRLSDTNRSGPTTPVSKRHDHRQSPLHEGPERFNRKGGSRRDPKDFLARKAQENLFPRHPPDKARPATRTGTFGPAGSASILSAGSIAADSISTRPTLIRIGCSSSQSARSTPAIFPLLTTCLSSSTKCRFRAAANRVLEGLTITSRGCSRPSPAWHAKLSMPSVRRPTVTPPKARPPVKALQTAARRGDLKRLPLVTA